MLTGVWVFHVAPYLTCSSSSSMGLSQIMLLQNWCQLPTCIQHYEPTGCRQDTKAAHDISQLPSEQQLIPQEGLMPQQGPLSGLDAGCHAPNCTETAGSKPNHDPPGTWSMDSFKGSKTKAGVDRHM